MNTNSTALEIISMLTENTGSALCDSGGIYGYQYQKNQKRDFVNEPETRFSFKNGIEVYHSLFHILNTHLEHDQDLQSKFDLFIDQENQKKISWGENMRNFLDLLKEEGNEIEIESSGYTYNYETFLDQDLIYVCFLMNDEPYVFVQSHNGCDARGGFPKPRIFKTDRDYLFLADIEAAEIYVDYPDNWEDDKDISWYSNNGYSFDGTSSNIPDLEDLEFLKEEDLEEGITKDQYINKPNNDLVFVDDQGNAYCPITGFKLIIARSPAYNY